MSMPDSEAKVSAKEKTPAKQQSWWSRVIGRSILSAIFGDHLEDKNFAASVIAILLVATLCYLAVFVNVPTIPDTLANIVFVVIGYYFGSKREKADEKAD